MVSVYKHQVSFSKRKLGDGIQIHSRIPKRHGNSILERALYYLSGRIFEGYQIRRIIKRESPDHVFFSFGGFAELDNPQLLETILSQEIDFSAIFHNNTEDYSFQWKSIELARRFCSSAAEVYLVSERIGEIFCRQIGLLDFRYRIIINPMEEPEDVSTDVYTLTDNTIKMAFIGTLDINVKGVALLLQAMTSRDWSNSNVILNLYGEGKDQTLISLLIKSFGLSDRVFFKGWTDDIDAVWNNHHLLVLPSFNEGMPMVIHEAMLRQRVVVATDVGGNSEIIEDGRTGFLAQSASLKHLVQALQRCIASRDQWSIIAKNARLSILAMRQKNLTIEDIIAELNHEQN